MRGEKEGIEKAGGQLVFIGNGSPQQARHFREEYVPGFAVYTDPSLQTYDAVGAQRGLWATFRPEMWGQSIRTFRKGIRQSGLQGHALQQGAVLVVLPGGEIPYRHINRYPGDHPNPAEPVAALGSALAAQAHAG